MQTFDMAQVRAQAVPAGGFALWWLGQAGYLIKSEGGTVLALDPYLTNSCGGFSSNFDLNRLVPPPLQPAQLAGIDGYVMTHSHQDHLDPETLAGYRAAGGTGPYVAPAETVDKLHRLGVADAEIIMTWPNREVEIGDITLRATFCIPGGGDDLNHVGYLMRCGQGRNFYFTGDTAYHDVIAQSVAAHRPAAMVTVINPAFRNMGPADAALLAKQLGVEIAIPCHYELFRDNCQPPQMFRTNLLLQGLGATYRELEHGVPYLWPETA